jgi:hypothetical protein
MAVAKSRALLLVLAMLMFGIGCRPVVVFCGEQVTLTGEINDSYQVVADDGQTYEVADNEKGNELVLNQILPGE